MARDTAAGRGGTLYDILPDGYGMLGPAIAGTDQFVLPLGDPAAPPAPSGDPPATGVATPYPDAGAPPASPVGPTDSAIPAFAPLAVGPQALTAGLDSAAVGMFAAETAAATGGRDSDASPPAGADGAVLAPMPLFDHPPGSACSCLNCAEAETGDGHDHAGNDDAATGAAADGGDDPAPVEGGPSSGGTVSTYSYSGENGIDSLLATYKWGGGLGAGTTLTYSFGTSSSVYVGGYSEASNGFAEFSDHQKTMTRMALDFWSSVADIAFTEVTDSSTVAGDLRFARSSDPSTAWAYYPSTSPYGGDVWVGPSSNYNDMSLGTYGFQTMLHEIGHALGLSHAHQGSVTAGSGIDWLGYTVMSYKSYEGATTGYRQNFYPTTPMANDIAAIQYLYGANTAYNNGDTTYSWGAGDSIFEAIWDSAGVDTIDWSNQSTGAVINLVAGEWNELGPAYASNYSVWPWTMESRTLMIADGVVIENATGGSGDDVITGNAADNTLEGGAGDDTLNGGDGDDTFVFGAGFGDDTIGDFTAGADSDDRIDLTAFGSYNFQTLAASIADVGGDAVITLDGNTITLTGIAKADLHYTDFVGVDLGGTYGNDTLVGTDSDDTILGLSGADTISGGAGDDTLSGDDGNDTLYGGDGNDILYGGAHRDALYGQAGTDTLYGGDGDDTLDGGTGADAMAGGAGDDLYIVDNASDTVTESAGAGADSVESSVSHTLSANVENLKLTGSAAIDGTGNAAANFIQGNAAANTLSGAGGDDTIFAFAGDDTVNGGGGADALYGDAGDDTIDGGAGDDTLYGGAGRDVFSFSDAFGNDTLADFSAGIDSIDITALTPGTWSALLSSITDVGSDAVITLGSNTITVANTLKAALSANDFTGLTPGASASDDTMVGTALADTLDGLAGADTMYGGDGDDTLDGSAGNDTLYGQAGDDTLNGGADNDTLDGGAGADAMVGGDGDDIYVVDDVDDTVTEGSNAGADTVRSAISYALGSDVENLELLLSADIDGTGNGDANVITGNAGANTLTGNAGDDALFGMGGNDTLHGGDGADSVIGGDGADTLYGDAGNDWIRGESGNDTLYGGAGRDRLFGEDGNDTLDGGASNDEMTGGAGDDTYAVDHVQDVVIESADEGTDLVQASVSYTLSSDVENLTLTGTDDIDATGNALDNALTGNAGANRLDGGSGADVMTGGTGDDAYVVDNAADTTTEASGEGTDTVESSITWTLGSNIENLTLTGASDIDGTGNALGNVLTGNSGVNSLDGGAGDDTLDGGAGADAMAGGAGDDTYVVDDAGDTVTENSGEGTDTVLTALTHSLAANVENLTLTGAAAVDGTGNATDNAITGNGAANTLTGNGGADTLRGLGGNDTLYGGDGGDTLLGGGGADVLYGEAGNDWMRGESGNDTLHGGDGNDSLFGEDHRDTLYGDAGNDSLNGGAGDDVLDGGTGDDAMTGGSGDDVFVVDSVSDTVSENASEGNDAIMASVSYTIAANVENLTLTGIAEIDGDGNDDANFIQGNGAANTLSGGGGNDTIFAFAGNDALYGGDGADALYGDAGDDVLDGGAGNDTLAGGAGRDSFAFSGTFGDDTVSDFTLAVDVVDLSGLSAGGFADVMSGAADVGGNAVITLAGGTITLAGVLKASLSAGDFVGLDIAATAGDDTIYGGSGNDAIDALGGNDTVYGDDGDDTLTGGDGADVLRGEGGADILNGGNLGDTLLGGDGGDTLNGDAGNDWMRGEDGDDTLNGGAGADRMFGEAGNDTLNGGDGADTLTGGDGSDRFVYSAVSEAGDTIADFTAGSGGDTIDISALLASFGYGGSDAFADGYVHTAQSGADTLVQVDSDGGGNGYVTLTTLDGVDENDLVAGNWVV